MHNKKERNLVNKVKHAILRQKIIRSNIDHVEEEAIEDAMIALYESAKAAPIKGEEFNG